MGQFDKTVLTHTASPKLARVITSSGFIKIPMTGTWMITLIGAGGSGASCTGGNYGGWTGGGAGGCVMHIVKLQKDEMITCVIGAQAAGVTGQSAGNSGGDSSVSGSSFMLRAGGGGGGNFLATSTAQVYGGAGGSASGGNIINVPGGSGGNAKANDATTGSYAASGGGAVGIFGRGFSAGNAQASGGYAAFTGGAGCGGSSGNATSSTIAVFTQGGSSIAPSSNQYGSPVGGYMSATGESVFSPLSNSGNGGSATGSDQGKTAYLFGGSGVCWGGSPNFLAFPQIGGGSAATSTLPSSVTVAGGAAMALIELLGVNL